MFEKRIRDYKGYGMIMAVCFLALLAIQRLYFGLRYFPVLDDWFLYYGNSLQENQWSDVILKNQLLAQRPLACLTDSYLIGACLPHLWIPYLITLCMLGGGLLLLSRGLDKSRIYTGGFLLTMMALFPFHIEATNWLSASSRICTALFFIGLSVFLLDRYLEKCSKVFLILYFICGFFCVSYYETALPVYILVNAFAVSREREGLAGRLPLLLIPVGWCMAMAAYYALSPFGGEVAARGAQVRENYGEHFSFVISELKNTGRYILPLCGGSLRRGVRLMWENHSYVRLVLAVLLSGAFSWAYMRYAERKGFSWKEAARTAVAGVLLVIGGLAIIFVLAYVRLSFRVLFFAFLGVGLLMDAGIRWLAQYRIGRVLGGIFTGVTVFAMTAAGIGEIDFYRLTNWRDMQLVDRMTESDKVEKMLEGDQEIYLFGAEEYYFPDCQNRFEHVRSTASMYAAFSGAIYYRIGQPLPGNIYAYYNGQEINQWLRQNREHCAVYCIENDGSLSEGAMLQDSDGSSNLTVIRKDGTIFGTLEYFSEDQYLFWQNE